MTYKKGTVFNPSKYVFPRHDYDSTSLSLLFVLLLFLIVVVGLLI